MYLDLTETQRLLKESLARYLDDKSGGPTLNPGGPRDRDLWHGLAADLGLFGMALPGEEDEIDQRVATNAVIMEELGRSLAVQPYLTSIILCGGLLGRSDSDLASRVRADLADGRVEIAAGLSENAYGASLDLSPVDLGTAATTQGSGFVITGSKAVVRWAPSADWLVVNARLGDGMALFLVPASAPGLTRRDYPTMDGAGAADLLLAGVHVPAEAMLFGPDRGAALLETVTREATVSLCAEAVGAMRRMIQMTTDYARERRQFGVAISSFQALQHLMVDMAIAVEQADALTAMATVAVERGAGDANALSSAAKVKVGQACRIAGQGAIQVHGGMGIADETPIGRYFKRTTAIEVELGSTEQHLRRYARLRAAHASGGARV